MSKPAPNRNTLYAQTFVDALVRAGLKAVCIAPGSRSTPLTLAFAMNEDVQVYSHLDERSCAFFALGLAMASRKPVAMVCTSGTAAANFFPAIIEANMSRVPLLVLTADRPHELRHSGANQTIDQVKLYGDHVLWSVDMALPEENPPAVAIRNVQTMAARAYATANGHMEWRRKGVVHLNFPFRKPLEPVEVAGDILTAPAHELFPRSSNLRPQIVSIDDENINIVRAQLDYAWGSSQVPGIIVLGVGDTNVRVNEVAEIWSLPVVADVTSGARFRGCPTVIAAYEYMPLELLPEPSVIIQFGAAPTSKRLTNYLNGIDSAFRVLVSNDGVWQDDMHHTDLFVQADPDAFCRALSQGVEREPKPVPRPFAVMDYAAWDLIDKEIDETFFDGAVYRRIARRISDINNLFLGNSSPVRAMDQYGKAVDAFTDVYASRGASGIDGQVSTALGIGVATGEHVYAILGDITFYHDMNGLLAIKRNNVSATFIVINNNGGGIFERLPIREFEPYHTEYFLTPHGLTFEHAAAMYGLEYAVADDFASLDRALDQYMKPGVSAIIEVKTNIKTDEARRQEIMRLVQEELRRQFGNKDNHEPLV